MRAAASVVISNHNYAAYLCDAVDSALGQTLPGTEVVVVDDGSTDGSPQLLAGYRSRVRLLCQPRRGQTAAMNAGFAASTGVVVVFLDADDVLEPSAVETAVAAMTDGAVVKAHWPVTTIDADGATLGGVLPARRLPEGDFGEAAAREGPQNLAFPPTSGNAWSRRFLDQVFPLPEFEARLGVGSASADALLSMLAPFAGPIVASSEPLTRYRIHGANDYAGSSLADRLDRHVAVTDLQFPVVESYCRASGRAVDVEAWRRHSYFHRLRRFRDAVHAATSSSSRILLIDDGHWGPALDASRRLVPFPAHQGEYWGPPADDLAAARAMAEERSKGATHVALAWQSFWWGESYPRFWRDLRRCTETAVETDDVLVLSFSRSS